MSANSVRVFERDGKWIVVITEGDECTEREFLNEEFAQNYSAGQALRLHAMPEKSPISAKR